MKSYFTYVIIFLNVLAFSIALPNTEEAIVAIVAKRCDTESYGDNGGTTYTSGDCSGSTFSGTNVVNTENSKSGDAAIPRRDCATSTIGDTTYTSGDCSGSTFTGPVVDTDAFNSTASGTKMLERGLDQVVRPPECQSMFDGWNNWCNVISSCLPNQPIILFPL